MQLFRRNDGAISVFLVMILVPCMLVASIFVDISRVSLGRAVAESSADLALNTLMTYYDHDLSEAYGLIGSCQNISDYFDMVSECFDQALRSQDVEDEEVQLLYQRVMKEVGGRFGDETISDFLLLENEAGASVKPIEGANMRNPAILQKQLVEFMKYRAPIIIVQELIELLASEEEKGGVKDSEESVADKPMVEAQEEYYKAEGELLEEANRSYWALREYTSMIEEDKFTKDTLQEYADRIDGYRGEYSDLHRLLIANLYNTEGLKEYTRPNVTFEEDSPSADESDRVNAEKVEELLGALEKAVEEFDTKKDALTDAGKDLMAKLPGDGDDESYAVQWWVRMNAAINAPGEKGLSKQVEKAGEKMADAYGKVAAMLECTPDPDVPVDWKDKAKESMQKAEDRQKIYLSKDSAADNSYVKTVSSLESVSKDEENKEMISGGSSLTVYLSSISGYLEAIKSQMSKYIEQLNVIIEGDSDKKVPGMQRIRELVEEYGKKLDQWESEAKGAKTSDGQNTELSIEHQETIGKIRNGAGNVDGNESEKIVRQIKLEEIDALEKRLINIRNQLQAVSDAIDKMKYGDSKIMEISSFGSFKQQAKAKIQADDIPLVNKDLAEYIAQKFGELFDPASGEVVVLQDMSDLSYSPELYHNKDRDAVPVLYHFYYQVFQEKKPSDVGQQKKAIDDKKEQAKKQEESIKNANRYMGPKGRDLGAGEKADRDAFELNIGILVKQIARLATMDITGIRDDIYIAEYIMNMFSYGAFENEHYYDLVKDAGKLGDLKLAGGEYRTVYERDYKGAGDRDKTWLSERPEDAYNKTLTNEMINEANNYAYLAEIEYILFGADNVNSVKKAYGEIYKIRFFLNYASALANFWGTSTGTGTAVNAVANAIALATAYIIPAPLTKLVLITMLAIFETGKDMDRLQAGFPVELYKAHDDWWISLEGTEKPTLNSFYSALSGANEKIEDAHGLRYSDYLTFFLFLGLNDKDTAEGIYRRMADVIEKNMELRIGGEKDSEQKAAYSLKKTQVYFQLNGRLRVKPLMLTLPYFTDYVDNPAMKDDWCTFDVEAIRGY